MGVMELQENQIQKPDRWVGTRHMVIFLLFLATVISFMARISMSIGILAMTKEGKHGFQVFEWSQSIRDTILSSFFWGYIVLTIPAGMLAGKFGGKQITFVAMLITGLVNLIIPIAATKGDWKAVVACRIVMGLAQGLLYPSLHGLIGQWTPIAERSRMGSFVYSGAQLGTIFEMMLAGVLAESHWGWPSIYYVVGAICVCWALLWFLLGASSPGTSRWISEEERKYMEIVTCTLDFNKKTMPFPWKAILASLPFWAINFAHSGQCFGMWTLLTEMPSYMDKVLRVNLKSNGLLSALPYVAMYVLSFVSSWTADFLVNRNITSLGTTRKIFNTIAFWGPAAALLGLTYIPPGHVALAVSMLTLTVGLNGAHYVGFMISHMDISPNFASTLMGITNACANIFSIMAPLSVSLVVQDEHSADEWRKVFLISTVFYFLSNLFFILFTSGEIQDWNEPKTSNAFMENGIKEDDVKSKELEKNDSELVQRL